MTPTAPPIVAISGSGPIKDLATATSVVQNYAQDLCARLALPAVVQVELVRSSEPTLTVGSERVGAAPHRDRDSAEGAGYFCHAIHQSRECLVTAGVAERLRQDWRRAGFAAPSEASGHFHSMLRETVRLGRRVDRLHEVCSQRGVFDPDVADEVREKALCHEGASLFRIVLSKDDYAAAFEQGGSPRTLPGHNDTVLQMRDLFADGLFYELGIAFRAEFVSDETMEANAFRFEWNDVASPPVPGLAEDAFLVNATPGAIQEKFGITAAAAVNPANGNRSAMVSGYAELRPVCEQAGFSTWDRFPYIVLCAASEVRRNAAAFLNTELVDIYMDPMAGAFPDLVARATERFGSILLARVLRDLLDDGISIRDLRGILDGMLFAWGTTTADGRKKIIFPTKAGILLPSPERRSAEQLSWAELVECARIVLRRYISHKYTRGQNTLVVLLLEPALEDLIHGWRLSPASDEEKNEVIGAVEDEVLTSTNPDTLVILTSVETRRPTRQLLRYAFPALPVVSYQELSPDINIQPIARIGLRSRTPPHNSTRIDSAN